MAWAYIGRILTYLVITMYFAVLYILLDDFMARVVQTVDFKTDYNTQDSLVKICIFFYVAMVGALIFYSLSFNNSEKRVIPVFYFVSTLLGIYMLLTFGLMVWGMIKLLTGEAESFQEEKSGDASNKLYLNKTLIGITVGVSVAGHL